MKLFQTVASLALLCTVVAVAGDDEVCRDSAVCDEPLEEMCLNVPDVLFEILGQREVQVPTGMLHDTQKLTEFAKTLLPASSEDHVELLRESIKRQLQVAEFRRVELNNYFKLAAGNEYDYSCLAIHQGCGSEINTIKVHGSSHPCLLVGRQLFDTGSIESLKKGLLRNQTVRTLVLVVDGAFDPRKDEELVNWIWSRVGFGGRLLLMTSPSAANAEHLDILTSNLRDRGMCIRGISNHNPSLQKDAENCTLQKSSPQELCAVIQSIGKSYWVSELLMPFKSSKERSESGTPVACPTSPLDIRMSREPTRYLIPKRVRNPLGYRTVVVNLASEHKKWELFVQNALPSMGRDVKAHTIHHFDAVVGRSVSLTPFLINLFTVSPDTRRMLSNPHEDHGFRRGVLGCSLSHLHLWREIASDSTMLELDGYLVFEDDATLPGVFRSRWNYTMAVANPDPRWDVLFLGHNSDLASPKIRVSNKLFAFAETPRSYGGGTYAYVIRKRGARALLARALALGMPQPVDWFMLDAVATGLLVAYQTVPDMVISPVPLSQVSTTAEPYPLSRDEQVCSRSVRPLSDDPADAPAGFSGLAIRAPSAGESLTAGEPLLLSVLVSPGNDGATFLHANRCNTICVRVGAPVQAGSSYCKALYDSKDVLLDPAWLGDGTDTVLHAAMFNGDGKVIESSRTSVQFQATTGVTIGLVTRQAEEADGEYYDVGPCVADVKLHVSSWNLFSKTFAVDHQLCLYTPARSRGSNRPARPSEDDKQWCIRVTQPDMVREFDPYHSVRTVAAALVTVERLDGEVLATSTVMESETLRCPFWKTVVTVQE